MIRVYAHARVPFSSNKEVINDSEKTGSGAFI